MKMANTTFSGPVRSENGFEVVTKSDVTGAVTTNFTFGEEGVYATPPAVTAATATVTPSLHAGRTVVLDRAAGQALTLPAATGTGHSYRFFLKTTITSNATTIKVANATDVMAGLAIVANDGGDTASIFETAADSDTVSFNGSTTGGIRGATVELEDVAAGLWAVRVIGAATGTEATPFAATVS
jgi:hypothetical protein